jgi:hypothetical protein
MKPHLFYYLLAGVGSVLQIVSFVILWKLIINNNRALKKSLTNFEGTLLKTVGILFLLKLVFQFMGSFPLVSEIIANNLDFVIAYLHWIFLGIVSISIFAFLNHFNLLRISKPNYLVYLIAFVLTESILFYKGLVVLNNKPLLENYFGYLTFASAIFLIAIAWLLLFQYQKNKDY